MIPGQDTIDSIIYTLTSYDWISVPLATAYGIGAWSIVTAFRNDLSYGTLPTVFREATTTLTNVNILYI